RVAQRLAPAEPASAVPRGEPSQPVRATRRPKRAAAPPRKHRKKAFPVAVIGYACRFPGGEDESGYWQVLSQGRDVVGSVPAARRRLAGVAEASGVGGFLEGIEQFDPLFFRLSPLEAEQMDPRQRLFLETAYLAVEAAGYGGSGLRGSRTGVFVGTAGQDYLAAAGPAGVNEYWATGSSAAILASRLSYFLDLQGPSLPVDTACSSSLVAVHLALESLRRGECQFALAGGVQLNLWLKNFEVFARMGALSPAGRCRAFDDRADGFVPSEGAGVVLLRPLDEALAAGDPIAGVLLASALNNDGRTNGLTAPNPAAQRQVLVEAWRRAGIDPASLSYLEAHGTGTALGDPIEVEGIRAAFGGFTSRRQFCQLGSVKTNLGHCE